MTREKVYAKVYSKMYAAFCDYIEVEFGETPEDACYSVDGMADVAAGTCLECMESILHVALK